MSRIQNFIQQLKERGVRKTLTIYVSSALSAVGIIKLFSEAYGLSPIIFTVAVTFLSCGMASAFVFAWFHGREGAQKFQGKEIAIHSVVLAIALFVSFRVAGAPPQTFLQADNGKIPSIAILYLKNLGPETDEPYSYGITQDLIVDIAKAGLVRVAPMKDILSLQTTTMPVDSIALKLRVRYVLDGTIKRTGDNLQLSGQIVEAATGATIWANRLQTKAGDAVILQGQLAQAIINALQLKPSDAVKKEITESRTTNPEAYEFYLRAKFLFEKKKTKEDILTARGMYQKAIDLDSTFTLAQLDIGETFISQGEYGQAEARYQRALVIAQRTNEKNEEASSLSRLGVVEWYRGNFSKALEYHSQSLKIVLALGNRSGEGKTLNNIAIVYYRQGDYGTALEYYTRSLKVDQELGDRGGEGIALNNIAIVHHTRGDYATALDYYKKSLSRAQELGDRATEGHTFSNMGSIYIAQGDYPTALDYYNKSLTRAKELGERASEGRSLSGIGKVYMEQDDPAKALDYYFKSLNIVQEVGDRAGEGYASSNIGVAYFKQANYNKAIEFLKKSDRILLQIDEKPERMAVLSWLALAELKMENRKGAQANIDSVEELFKLVPKPEEFVLISWNVYRGHLLLGNQQKASEYLERAYREVIACADKISDKAMRQSYLTNVRTNRDVITAWKKFVDLQKTSN